MKQLRPFSYSQRNGANAEVVPRSQPSEERAPWPRPSGSCLALLSSLTKAKGQHA